MLTLLRTRVFDLVFVLFGVSIITFLMIRFIPGDAVQIMLGANTEITPERLDALRRQVGLDRPMVEQYLVWLSKILQGDLGTSLWTGAPVGEEIAARIGVTIELTVLSLAVAILLAVPAGRLMAYVRSSWGDYTVRILTIIGITVPSFWLGALLILAMYRLAPTYPSLGYVPFTEDPVGNLQRMLLPTVALSLPILASLARIVRSAMLDALGRTMSGPHAPRASARSASCSSMPCATHSYRR